MLIIYLLFDLCSKEHTPLYILILKILMRNFE